MWDCISSGDLFEVVLVQGPCPSLHQFITQLLYFFSQLLQPLLFLFNLLCC